MYNPAITNKPVESIMEPEQAYNRDALALYMGLKIFMKYDRGNSVVPEHDMIYTGHDVPPEKISDEDKTTLKENKWQYDSDLPAWTLSFWS